MLLLCLKPCNDFPFHLEKKPKSLQWPSRPCLVWSSITFLTFPPTTLCQLPLSATLTSLLTHQSHFHLKSLHWLLPLSQKHLPYMATWLIPSPASSLCSSATFTVGTTLTTLFKLQPTLAHPPAALPHVPM